MHRYLHYQILFTIHYIQITTLKTKLLWFHIQLPKLRIVHVKLTYPTGRQKQYNTMYFWAMPKGVQGIRQAVLEGCHVTILTNHAVGKSD